MNEHRRAISIAAAIILILGILPVHFAGPGAFTQVHAAEEPVFSDLEAVASDKTWLTDKYMWGFFLDWIQEDLELPTIGPGGSSIAWSSSRPDLIDAQGKVVRPPYSGINSYDAVLTATIAKGTASDTAVFQVSVAPLFGSLGVQLDYGDIGKISELLQLNGSGQPGLTYMSNAHLFALNCSPETAGSVFTRNKIQLARDLSFSTRFLFEISSEYQAYDEGFTFTLQADSSTALGTGGFDSMGAIDASPSLSIEFDTKGDSEAVATASFESLEADAGHHVAVYTNGEYQAPIATAPAPISGEDGPREFSANQRFKVWIQYDGTAKKLEIYLGRESLADPVSPLVSVDVDLASIFQTPSGESIQDVYAGFTGHGAEARSVHASIYEWGFKNDPFPIEYDLPYSVQNLYKDASSVSVSAETIDSEGHFAAVGTVIVKDTQGDPVAGVPVIFSTDFGLLDPASAITDANGCAAANLTSPASGTAKLRATAQGGAYAEAKAFLIVTDEAKINKDYDLLTEDRLLKGNTALDFVRSDLSLPAAGENGSAISWSSSNETFVTSAGAVARPSAAQGDQTVTLTAHLTNGTAARDKEFTVIVKIPDLDMVALDAAWLADLKVLNGNAAWDQVVSTLFMPAVGESGSSISWTSSLEEVVSTTGIVSRPAYPALPAQVALTASISMGAEVQTRTFSATVLPSAATDSDLLWEAYGALETGDLLNGNIDFDHVVTALALPLTGLHGSSISWATSDPAVITQTGAVTRPAFLAGDAAVTLTATITIGLESTTKIFTCTVKENEPTDEQAVNETYAWLTEDAIRGTNPALTQVTSDLPLHTAGAYSTQIQWASDRPLVLDSDGILLHRPTFTEGNAVVKLTALLTRGEFATTKEFEITVPAFPSTDEEAVAKTWDGLTYEAILGENEDAQGVQTPLTLAASGEEGATISWRCAPAGFISMDPGTIGQLSPPSFTNGDAPVTLVAAIGRGSKSLEKTFEVIVKALPISDEEAVTLDSARLRIADTLGLNPSPYAVTENLSFSTTSLYGSTITYTSGAPDVLSLGAGEAGSIAGQVIRPAIGEGNRSITVSASVTRGSQTKAKVFEYTVLARLDTEAPVPVSIAPAHNSVDVAYSTKETVVTFNEDIVSGDGTKYYGYLPKYFNVTLNGSPMPDSYMVRFEGKKLIILARSGLMPAGRNEILIPAGTVRDKAGNPMAENLAIAYTVEERIVRNIGLASSIPANGAVNVPVGSEISFTFDTSGLTKGSNFSSIALMNELYPSIPIQCELRDNKVTVSFKYAGWSLQKGKIYWLLIPGAAVADRFLNQNQTQLLSFVVAPDTLKPVVVSTFPKQDETGVSVLQHIQLNYKDAVLRSAGQARMTDAAGKPVALATGELRNSDTVLDLIPLAPLSPNTRYTVVLPADFVKTKMAPQEPAASDLTFSFTTGENRLSIQSVDPVNFAWDVPVNEPIRLVFNSPVQEGPNDHLLSMTDSAGNDVATFLRCEGNTAEVKPLSVWLEPYKTYTLTIPAGAVADGAGRGNDSLTFTFTTGRKLDLAGGGSFSVQPSPRYLVNKKITFDTAALQETFRKTGRKLLSCEWDLGDGQTATGLQTEHTYTVAGNYTARLTATDNKGIEYELTQPMSIRALDRKNIELAVTPEKLQNLIREDEYVDPLDGYPGSRIYRVYAKNEGIYLPDEKVNVYLYKSGTQIKEMGTVSTQYQENGVPVGYFVFDYKNPSYLGNYELVFVYGAEDSPDSQKTIRRTVHIADQRKKQDLWIQPVNALTGRVVDVYPYLEFEVDGIKLDGIKKQDGENVYYMIEDLPTGFHSLKLIRTEGWAHYSDTITFWHTSTTEIAVLPVQAASPGISRIWAKLETGKGPVEISSNMEEYRTFIDVTGTAGPPPIRFNIDIDWNETRPGYFEMQYNGWTQRFYDPWFDFEPLGLYPDSKLLVRAVNPMGEASPWVDCKIDTVDPPTNPYVWLNYVDGEYLAETDMFMPDSVAGKIEGLDKMPLMDHSQSFGTQPGMNTAYGAVKLVNGKLYMDMSFNAAGSYGESKKKPKMVSVGYDVEGETGGHVYMIYDPAVGYWSMDAGEFYVRGDVSVYKEKGKVIPVINLGAKGRVTIGTGMGGTLYIDNAPEAASQYSGILYLEPYVKGEVYGGIEGLNVEGYVRGSVNTEVHVPTGYIKVVPELTSKVNKTVLFVTTTVFDETWSTEWNNGKDPVIPIKRLSFDRMTAALADENASYEVIPRNYLLQDPSGAGSARGEVRAMAADGGLSILSAEDDALLKDNVYPYADVQLIRNGAALTAVWTDDDPARTDLNRTRLYSSTKTPAGWSGAAGLDDDGTADFSPAVALAGGEVLIAWQDFGGAFTEEDIVENNLDRILKKAEISVADGPAGPGSLTGDDFYDHSPAIASLDDGSALLVWAKSDKTGNLDIPQAGAETGRLLYSIRSGGTWGEAMLLRENLPLLSDCSLVAGDDSFLLLYTLDADNDITTPEDSEVWASVYQVSSGAFGAPIQITDNDIRDSDARGVFVNGDWFLLWKQDERYVYREGLAGETRSAEALEGVSGKTALALGDDFIALVYQKGGENNQRTLSSLFYDLEKEMWSHEIPLMTDPGYVRSFSPAFDGEGNLGLLYTHADIITEVKDETEYFEPGDRLRLMFSSYTPEHDLAMAQDDPIVLSTKNPTPETAVRVSCLVENKGDFAERAKLALYEGTSTSGTKIGEATTDLIPAGASSPVTLEWIVPEEVRPEYSLYAVVASTGEAAETDTTNNTAQLTVAASDVELVEVEWESLPGYQYLVKPLIFNNGSTPLENIEVVLEHDQTEVASAVIERLEPGEHGNAGFVISSEGFTAAGTGRYPMTATLSLPEGVKENTLDNNVLDFELDTKIIALGSMDPADGQQQVDVDQALTLKFNRLLAEKEDFDQIKLTDGYLNPVPAAKTIDGDLLTVTPDSPLQYGTQYTLLIPENAIGDAYGRSMRKAESIGFTTVSQNPAPVFSAPFDGSMDIETDADIRIQYSQAIQAGSAFSGIYLEQVASNLKTPVLATIDGQWLNLKPARGLSGNTAYAVHIPMGAVKNMGEDHQSADHDFTFTTKVDPAAPDPGSGSKPPVQGELSLTPVLADSLSGSGWSVDQEGFYTLDVTREANLSDGVRVTLSGPVLDQLLAAGTGLRITSEKGTLTFPAQWIRDLPEGGKQSIIITIAGRSENAQEGSNDPDRVSGLLNITVTLSGRPLTTFDEPVSVVMPVRQEEIRNGQRVIACRYDELSGKWVPLGGKADLEAGTITFRTGHFSDFAAFETVRGFQDVTAAWAKGPVEILASRGLISGKKEGIFDPSGNITRAELTAMVIRALYVKPAAKTGRFSDVAGDAWYAENVETAAALGMMSGVGNGRFAPLDPMTREQLATIAYRLIAKAQQKEPEAAADHGFSDQSSIAAYAVPGVNYLASKGIMVGSFGRFDPKASLTRQEAAVVLYRLLVYLGEM